MTLTTQQVQRIFELVKLHIPYYDLQVEMVDHLASSIEEQIEQNTSLSFEQALQTAFGTFGSSGFKLLIRKRRRSLNNQKFKVWFQCIKEYFSTYRFSYLLISFILAFCTSSLWIYPRIALPVHNQFLILWVLAVYSVVYAVKDYQLGKVMRCKLLCTEAFRASVWGGLIYPHLIIMVLSPFITNQFLFGIVIAIIVLMFNTMASVNSKFINKAKELYPEAFVKA